MKMDDNHSEDDSVTAKHLFLSLSLYQYPGTYLSVKTSDPSFLKYHQAKKKKEERYIIFITSLSLVCEFIQNIQDIKVSLWICEFYYISDTTGFKSIVLKYMQKDFSHSMTFSSKFYSYLHFLNTAKIFTFTDIFTFFNNYLKPPHIACPFKTESYHKKTKRFEK